jgi:hypothetical protein
MLRIASPKGGNVLYCEIFPLWGKYRRSRGRGFFLYEENK